MKYPGIYLAYFTAEFGTSLGIFLVSKNTISGGDLGGGIYDGEFSVEDSTAVGFVTFKTLQGGTTITGANNDLPVSYETPISLMLPLEDAEYHELMTLNGPVNVRFEKIRSL